MNEQDEKILADCVNCESFGWERFVDRFLPLVSKVVDFAADEHPQSIDADRRTEITARIFNGLAADEFAHLKAYDGSSSLSTYLTVFAQRKATNLLKN